MEQANQIRAQLKKHLKDATHHCYALVLEPTKEKTSDDGEPSGTAGLPMLNQLKQNNLVFVLAVVIRYFGGVKLGAGGLVRAYSKVVKEALKQAQTIPYQVWETVSLDLTYEELPKLNLLPKENWFEVMEKQFNETVQVTVRVNENKVEEFEKLLTNLLQRTIKKEKNNE
jgi:uncharacterized YigZ family protein